MKRLHLKIYGQVQGIFFRVTALEKAQKFGLIGWVKNANDGTVELTAEGEENKLNELKEWCKVGPELARVERVEEEWTDIDKAGFSDFKITS
jgi:acylphosphatase